VRRVLGLAAASLGVSFAAIGTMPDVTSVSSPPGQGKKFRWPKAARPTTQPDGESRQVRRARERAEAKHQYGKDWRKFLAAKSKEVML